MKENPQNLPDGAVLDDIALPASANIRAPESLPDLADLALSQNFAELTATFTDDVTVPVRKPNKQDWISPHPDSKKWLSVAIIEDVADHKAPYVLTSKMTKQLEPGDWSPKCLVPYITRLGTICFWPVRLPDSEGKLDTWSRSAISIAASNGNQWIRVTPNMEAQAYQTTKPVAVFANPEWPDNLEAIYQKALAPITISSKDHPLLKRLRGEI